MTLGHFLKSYRLRARLTQMEVAQQLGYGAPQFISNWERDRSAPPHSKLRLLCRVLAIEPTTLREFLERDYLKHLDQYLPVRSAGRTPANGLLDPVEQKI